MKTHRAIALLLAGFGLALTMAATPALPAAAPPTDCPPAGRLPRYNPDGVPQLRAYASADFYTKRGDDVVPVTVAGRRCTISYLVMGEAMSDLEIQTNYRDQFAKLGAQVLQTDNSNTVVKFTKGDNETWIHVYSQENEIDVTVVEKAPLKQSLLPPSGHDYRLIGHMPNYVADPPTKKNFDQADFPVKDGDDVHPVKVQGAKYTVSYAIGQGVQATSDLEIQENYRNALKALGADILLADGGRTVARLDQNGQHIWIDIYSQENAIEINTIEEKAFQASIQPPTANVLKTALDKDSRVSLYVNFDFNKATLKPDAQPVIAQVVALLKANPALKLAIEGHTDNVGVHDYNTKLSQDRAAAVVAAIVAGGIAKDRLTSSGYGPDKPIADNDTSEGRAKNRRVDLVKD